MTRTHATPHLEAPGGAPPPCHISTTAEHDVQGVALGRPITASVPATTAVFFGVPGIYLGLRHEDAPGDGAPLTEVHI
jgi:hypothetical protein